jgi:subtilisin family serine protease
VKTKFVAILVTVLLMFSSGCGGQMRPFSFKSKSTFDQNCRINESPKVTSISPFSNYNLKVNPPDFETLDPATAVGTFSVAKTGKMTFDGGFLLNVLVNRDCISRGQHAQDRTDFEKQITGFIRPFLLNDKTSIHQSVTFEIPRRMTLEQISEFFNQEPCVVGVSPERKLQALSVPNDSRYQEQNALVSLNHAQAWPNISILSEDVVVAVIDSGTDLTHPELLPTTWINPNEIAGNNIDDDRNGYIDDVHGYSNCYLNASVQGAWQIEHGEHIHGIIAAAANNSEGIVGVASPTVKVMHMMIFGNSFGYGTCSPQAAAETARLEEGIRYAADNGAQVINLSWGARGFSTTTLAAVQYAISKGALVATAAANAAEEISNENPWFPAVYAKDLGGLVSVAATDANPSSGFPKCAFSNVSNSFVEIAAPGCDTTVVNSTVGLNGMLSTMRVATHQGYGYMPGTSMATPHVAAAAGLVYAYKWSKGLHPTPAEVEEVIKLGARSQQNLMSYVSNGRHLDLNLLMISLAGAEEGPPKPNPECPTN